MTSRSSGHLGRLDITGDACATVSAMLYLTAKAVIYGVIITAVSEISKRILIANAGLPALIQTRDGRNMQARYRSNQPSCETS